MELKTINMNINAEKTTSMMISRNENLRRIRIDGKRIEQVKYFKYLQSIIECNGRLGEEIDKNKKCGQNLVFVAMNVSDIQYTLNT